MTGAAVRRRPCKALNASVTSCPRSRPRRFAGFPACRRSLHRPAPASLSFRRDFASRAENPVESIDPRRRGRFRLWRPGDHARKTTGRCVDIVARCHCAAKDLRVAAEVCVRKPVLDRHPWEIDAIGVASRPSRWPIGDFSADKRDRVMLADRAKERPRRRKAGGALFNQYFVGCSGAEAAEERSQAAEDRIPKRVEEAKECGPETVKRRREIEHRLLLCRRSQAAGRPATLPASRCGDHSPKRHLAACSGAVATCRVHRRGRVLNSTNSSHRRGWRHNWGDWPLPARIPHIGACWSHPRRRRPG